MFFYFFVFFFFFFQAEDGIRDPLVTGVQTCALPIFLLIPRFGFAGPAMAFVCAETAIVGIWMFQLTRLGFPANLGNVIWRPLAAGIAMTLVLFAAGEAGFLWQIAAGMISVIVYALVLLALKTFSMEEIHHARA